MLPILLDLALFGLLKVWIAKEREIFDSEEGKELLKEWNLPTTLRGVGAIALGYANEEPKEAASRKIISLRYKAN